MWGGDRQMVHGGRGLLLLLLLLQIPSIACNTVPEATPFQTFPYPEGEAEVADLVAQYCQWHKDQLRPTVDCRTRRFLVFRATAGIGDTVGALVGRWIDAMQTGRLFMVDWSERWDVGFVPPHGIRWHYAEAVAEGLACESYRNYARHVSGHRWTGEEHEIPAGKFPSLDYLGLQAQIVLPSNVVQQGLAALKQQMTAPLVIGLQIRAGMMVDGAPERLQHEQYFLGYDDYKRFYYCAWEYAASKRATQWQVLLLTDNTTVRTELTQNFQARGIEVLQTPGPLGHVLYADDSEAVLKSFVDFFSLSQVHVAFVTHNSLFGSRGTELLGRMVPKYAISDSQCAVNTHLCATPKWPRWCNQEDFEYP